MCEWHLLTTHGKLFDGSELFATVQMSLHCKSNEHSQSNNSQPDGLPARGLPAQVIQAAPTPQEAADVIIYNQVSYARLVYIFSYFLHSSDWLFGLDLSLWNTPENFLES